MVNLVYRKQSGFFSIENVFDAVYDQLSPVLPMKKTVLPYQRANPYSMLVNIRRVRLSQTTVNHVTGDVHYALLGLSDRVCNILTVHDVALLEQLGGWKKRVAEEVWFRRPLRKARYVTCISQKTARDVVQLCPEIEEKVTVIPNPVLPAFRESAPRPTIDSARVLHVGTSANKNLQRVIHAVAGLDVQLVVIGRLSPTDAALLMARKIDYVNRYELPLEELVAEYEKSDIVVFASLYEGFGLPIAEANTVGRPVITSKMSPMADVAQDAALLVDPTDVRAIRAALVALIDNAGLRADLINRGKENARRFAADHIAGMYGRLYAMGIPCP